MISNIICNIQLVPNTHLIIIKILLQPMGSSCIAPRPKPSTFSKYIRSPKKQKQQKQISKSRIQTIPFQRSFIKDSGKIETKSRFNQTKRIELDMEEGHQTLPKIKMRRVESSKNYEFETPLRIEDENDKYESLVKSRHVKKALDISEILNRSRETKVKEIQELEEESHVVEPFQLSRFAHMNEPFGDNYSFQQVKINTNIKDLDIDIHIQPPRTSKGYFSLDDATFKIEEKEVIPNKVPQLLALESKPYFNR